MENNTQHGKIKILLKLKCMTDFYSSLETIKELLNEYSEPINTTASSIYAQIKLKGLQKELEDEKNLLKQLFDNETNENNLKIKFKELAQKREICNQGSCFSFFAMADDDCNILYWKIAKLLFNPKTLAEMFEILFPSIKQLLTIVFEVNHPHKKRKLNSNENEKVILYLKKEGLNSLSYKIENSPELLKNFIVIDDSLFDLADLKSLPFALHQKFFQVIDNYPALKKKIYQHNSALQELQTELELVALKGTTPRKALYRLMQHLNLAGEKYTGKIYAPDSLKPALDQFALYRNTLPKTFHKNLLSLETFSGDNLKSIFKKIDHGDCVETAANFLKEILENTKNQTILDTLPQLKQEELDKIAKKYEKQALEICGNDKTMRIPNEILRTQLEKIQIKNVYDFIYFLINIPTSEYECFLKNINIQVSLKLANAIRDGFLNKYQMDEFFNYIIKQKDKFGGTTKILLFGIRCNQANFLRNLINTFSKEDIYEEFQKIIDMNNNRLLHIAAKEDCTEALTVIFETFDHCNIKSLALLGNNSKDTPLHLAASNGSVECMKIFLSLFDKLDDLKIILITNSCKENLIHHAVKSNNIDLVTLLFDLSNDDSKWWPILEASDKYGHTPLHFAADRGNEKITNLLLGKFSEHKRTEEVRKKDSSDNTPLHYATRIATFNIISPILKSLPKAERLEALLVKNAYNFTPIYSAIVKREDDSIKIIFDLLPYKDFLTAICTVYKERNNNTAIHQAAQNNWLQPVIAILEFLSKEDRLKVVKIKNEFGQNVFQLAEHHDDFYNHEIFAEIVAQDSSLIDENNLKKLDTKFPKCGLKRLASKFENEEPILYKTLSFK